MWGLTHPQVSSFPAKAGRRKNRAVCESLTLLLARAIAFARARWVGGLRLYSRDFNRQEPG
jgi:hypothetical protein